MDNKNCRPKAAILTWCYNNGKTNYGQILQCYAMQILVQRLGYDTKVIRYRRRNAEELLHWNQEYESYIDLYELCYRLEKIENKIDIRILKFIRFIKENIRLSNQCYTKEQIEQECKDCTALFCGSDQIWNPIWFDDVYALNFGTMSQKRISYASSGVIVENNQAEIVYKKLGRYLDRFDVVTVREENSIEILKKYTKQNIVDVVDPTLLLSREDWNQVAAQQNIDVPYIFCYSLGKIRTHKVLLKKIMKKYNAKKIFFITSGHYENENELETGGYFYSVKDAGPSEFISLIRNAEAVCTDSFHGLALSIVYQKQFYIFERNESKVHLSASIIRQENLLKKVGIEEQRLVKCVKEIQSLEVIDYSKVNLNQHWNKVKNLDLHF